MEFKIGSIWKDKNQNLSKVKIVNIHDDHYKKIEYKWIHCEYEKEKENKTNFLPHNTFLNIYILDDINDNCEENKNYNIHTELNCNVHPNSSKHIKTSGNKTIEIFDNIFTSSERQYHLSYVQKCSYILGNHSNDIFWQQNRTFFQCVLNNDQLNELGIISSNSFNVVRQSLLDQQSIKNSWILASTPFSSYQYHVDTWYKKSTGKTLLYYVNDRWDRNWGGETLFADEAGDPEYAVQYKPGRIVIFDNSIEHRPASISMEADEFRFIFVAQFLSKDFIEDGVR